MQYSIKTMSVNRVEYRQIRKCILLVVLVWLIYLVYSIVAVYYDNKSLETGPIKSYEIVSKHSGAVNITSYIIVRYMGKDYTVTVSRKDINENKLYKPLYYNKWTDILFYDIRDDIFVRAGFLSIGLLSIICMYHYIKGYHGGKQ
mgnify:FL=1